MGTTRSWNVLLVCCFSHVVSRVYLIKVLYGPTNSRFKLLLPPSEGAPEGDSEALIREKAIEAGVLALPGTSFFISGKPTPYVRASFSLLPEKDVDEALRRLAKIVRLAQQGE